MESLIVLAVFIAAPLAASLCFFVSGEFRHPAAPALALALGAGVTLSRALSGFSRLRATFAHRTVFVPLIVLFALVVYPVDHQSETDDFKGYAEALVAPRVTGEKPAATDYDRAEWLLGMMGDSMLERFTRNESLLLVYSNRAIQFASVPATQKLIHVAENLWKAAPRPGPGLPEGAVNRIYGNLRRRVVALGSQPFLVTHPDLDRELALLGSHDYAEIDAYVRVGRTEDALRFVDSALEVAPSSVELMAERGRLELALGRDTGIEWLQNSFNGWPKRALPAVLLGEYFLQHRDRDSAAMFLREAVKREPDAEETRRLAAEVGG